MSRGAVANRRASVILRVMKPIPTEIVFLSAKRTPFGTYGGALKDVTATDLGVHAAKAAGESNRRIVFGAHVNERR